MRHMRIVSKAGKSRWRLWMVVCLAALITALPGGVLADSSLVQQISLDASDSNQPIEVPEGAKVSVQNNYPGTLYETTILKHGSGKKLASIETFHSGQTFGLEFPRKGSYSVCYSLKKNSEPADSICLQINVVRLQTA